MQRDTGDLAGAIATLEGVVRRGIADQSMMVVLAGYLQESGALDKSAALLEAVLAAHPDYAEAYNCLGVVHARQGRHADARAAFRKVLELDPTSAKAYENLAIDELGAGDLNGAAADLARALALDPRLAERAQRARCGVAAPGARGGGDCRVENRARAESADVRRALQPRHGARTKPAAATRRGPTWSASSAKRRAVATTRTSATAGPARRRARLDRRSAALQGCRGQIDVAQPFRAAVAA